MVEETKSTSNIGDNVSNSSRQAFNKILGATDGNFTSQ